MIELASVIAKRSPVYFDIMLGDRFYRSVALDLTVGIEYSVEELSSFTRIKIPSLATKKFYLLPTTTPVFNKK